MDTYVCSVTPTDMVSVYTTVQEDELVAYVAMVMVNKQGEKISVLLNRDQVIEMQNQLNDFVINGHR